MDSGATTGGECASLSTGETSKRQSENSEEEPPRKMRPVPVRASEEDVTLTDRLGRSPLHRAAEEGDVQRVRELVARGADTRLRDRWSLTPLHRALVGRKEEAAELLTELDCGNNIKDASGRTPLHMAASSGYLETVRRLLAGGAGTRVPDGWRGTPLHAALLANNEAAAELLVGADRRNDVRDLCGQTPLHLAAARGFRGVVATLLHSDLDPHVRSTAGRYPVQRALRRERYDVAKMILSSYALKDISVDWAELKLSPDDLRFCVEEVSRCSEEIRLMRETRVGASSLSCHELVTRHVSRAAPRLRSESVRDDMRRDRLQRDFPHYVDVISLRLRSAEERRKWMDRSLRSFSLLPPELPPLPVTCTDVILRCPSDRDMENFVLAVTVPSGK